MGTPGVQFKNSHTLLCPTMVSPVWGNSGRATLGVTRIEGQVGAWWTYTPCGLTTNLAARLAELSSGSEAWSGRCPSRG